jgi:hypothetical protein
VTFLATAWIVSAVSLIGDRPSTFSWLIGVTFVRFLVNYLRAILFHDVSKHGLLISRTTSVTGEHTCGPGQETLKSRTRCRDDLTLVELENGQ